MNNDKLAKKIQEDIKKSRGALARQYKNTRKCQAFVAGDLMEYTDKLSVRDNHGKTKNALVQFNKVKPYVNAVLGFFVQNRRVSKYASRSSGDQGQWQSDYTNSLAKYVRNNTNADIHETRQDRDLLVNGYGAVDTAMSYGEGYTSRDPNGEIIMGRLDPLKVGWDATAREPNVLDARFVWYEKEYELETALELFDSSDEGDFDEMALDDDGDDYEYNPRGGGIKSQIREIYDVSPFDDKMVRVYFYQWYEIEEYYRAENPIYMIDDMLKPDAAMILESIAQRYNQNDDLFEFDPRADILTCDSAIKKELEEAFGELIEFHAFKRRVYKTAVASGRKIFTQYKSLSQQGFTIKIKTGEFDEKNKIWVGMVNSMIDPVLYYNKSLTELLYMIAASSKGGVLYEEGAIKNIREFEANYAKTNKNAEVAKGALSGGKIQPKREMVKNSGLEDLIGIADAALPEVNGIDKSFLGSSESRTETAMLQRQRIKQALNTLACYADAITFYQKEHAHLLLDFMRELSIQSRGMVFRMEQGDESELVPLLPNHVQAEYDVEIQDAPDSATDKEEKANMLILMADKLLAIGDPTGKAIYAIALKYLGLDNDDRMTITQALVPQQDNIDPAYVQQLEQQLQQIQSEMNKAGIEKIVSETMKNMAQTEELKSRRGKIEAETVKTLEDADGQAIENDLMAAATDYNITI